MSLGRELAVAGLLRMMNGALQKFIVEGEEDGVLVEEVETLSVLRAVSLGVVHQLGEDGRN